VGWDSRRISNYCGGTGGSKTKAWNERGNIPVVEQRGVRKTAAAGQRWRRCFPDTRRQSNTICKMRTRMRERRVTGSNNLLRQRTYSGRLSAGQIATVSRSYQGHKSDSSNPRPILRRTVRTLGKKSVDKCHQRQYHAQTRVILARTCRVNIVLARGHPKTIPQRDSWPEQHHSNFSVPGIREHTNLCYISMRNRDTLSHHNIANLDIMVRQSNHCCLICRHNTRHPEPCSVYWQQATSRP